MPKSRPRQPHASGHPRSSKPLTLEQMLRRYERAGGTPQLGLTFEAGEVKTAAVVPKYASLLQVVPGSIVRTAEGDVPFPGGSGSDDPDQRLLQLFIRQCSLKSRAVHLTAGDWNNLGYAYACLQEPDLDKSAEAFHKGLEKREPAAVMKRIQENMKALQEARRVMASLASTRSSGPRLPDVIITLRKSPSLPDVLPQLMYKHLGLKDVLPSLAHKRRSVLNGELPSVRLMDAQELKWLRVGKVRSLADIPVAGPIRVPRSTSARGARGLPRTRKR